MECLSVAKLHAVGAYHLARSCAQAHSPGSWQSALPGIDRTIAAVRPWCRKFDRAFSWVRSLVPQGFCRDWSFLPAAPGATLHASLGAVLQLPCGVVRGAIKTSRTSRSAWRGISILIAPTN